MKNKNVQLYSNDCGLNAIKNILDIFKIKYNNINLEYDKNGTTLENIQKSLSDFFYDVKAVSFDVLQLKNVKNFDPYITLIGNDFQNHYIVIYKKTKKYLYILDSLCKHSYKVSYNQFKKIDLMLSIVPTNPKTINLSIRKYKGLFLLPIITTIESLFLLSTTVLIQQIIDNGLSNTILYFIVQVLLLLIVTIKTKIFLLTFKKMDKTISISTLKGIYNLNESFLTKYDINEISYRINDAYSYKEMILSFFYDCLDSIILFLFALSLMMLYSYKIALLVLSVCIIAIVFSILMFKKTKILVEEKRKAEYEFFNNYLDSFKKNNPKKYEEKSLKNLINFQEKDYQNTRLNLSKNVFLVYFQTFTILLVITLYFIFYKDDITKGYLVAIINLVTLMLQPLLDICSKFSNFSNISFIRKRLKDIEKNRQR